MRSWVLLGMVAACGASPVTPGGDDDAPPPCTTVAGTFHALAITSGGEARAYFLHIPEAARCEMSPLWIDFHGTAGDMPEEAYGTDEAIAVADAEAVILVRPRSRSSVVSGANIYRWDENAGDLDRNRAFVRDLVADLEQHYAIDPSRIIVSGFSSGANMAAQYLRPDELAVAGVATIGGGFWDVPASALTRIPAHVYSVTGFRDYMTQSFEPLRDLYRAARLDDDRWYWRQANTGHELYGWHMAELVPWLLRGERSPRGTLASDWTNESILTSKAILSFASTTSGLIAGTSEGGAFRRGTSGWAPVGALPATAHVTSMCSDGTKLFAAAEMALFTSANDGTSWTQLANVPEPEGAYFGAAWLTAIDCAADRSLLGAGLWVGVESTDHAASWQAAPVTMTRAGVSFEASIAALARNPSGTAVAVGLDFMGRRASGGAFEMLAPPVGLQVGPAWWNGVAAVGDKFWTVGDAGAIVASTDDGVTWTAQPSSIGEDLYAVAFADAQTGAAVGQHGAVVVTHDGGKSWSRVPFGLDVFLGAVTWLDPHTLVVAGEAGTIARHML